jgi:hypothetical protein
MKRVEERPDNISRRSPAQAAGRANDSMHDGRRLQGNTP